MLDGFKLPDGTTLRMDGWDTMAWTHELRAFEKLEGKMPHTEERILTHVWLSPAGLFFPVGASRVADMATFRFIVSGRLFLQGPVSSFVRPSGTGLGVEIQPSIHIAGTESWRIDLDDSNETIYPVIVSFWGVRRVRRGD